MVRQIISLHCGQAGMRTGCVLWELLLAEQGLSYEGLYDSSAPSPSPSPRPIGGPPKSFMKGPPEEGELWPQSAEDCFFAEGELGKRVPR